ncbi:hypothetical protein GCM10023350_09250 [Nocardioides endophyticus]|uniref:PE family protein n=1 Tax=Nocardioides endophyticus TaxID=1353775 RepID=A0ABP8YGM5_9ACTN
MSNAEAAEGKASAAWIALAFDLSAYAGLVVANHNEVTSALAIERAASTANEVVSSS